MISVLEESGTLLKEGFGSSLMVKDKDGSNNIVTDYDFRSEELIIGRIKEMYPKHSFLAEESGMDKNDKGFRWIIDPLDGTVNFANRIPIFCVSIALEVDGQLFCGGVYNPMTSEMFTVKVGAGAFFGTEKMFVSNKASFNSSLLATGFPYHMKKSSQSILKVLTKAITKGVPIRRLGAAAIDLAYTADGRYEGFWETGLQPWDVAAGILMVRESGGSVKNFEGNEYSLGDNSIVAGNKIVVDSLLEIVRSNEN